MNVDEIRKVGVVGAGIMGSGISEVVAKTGAEVVFVEAKDEFVERGRRKLAGSLARAVEKGKLSEDERAAIDGRISGGTDFGTLADVDLVVEAVSEDLEIKVETFRKLDEITRPEVVLATNTSSLPIVRLATETKRPDKVVGMHFFNPPPVMKLLELVRALTTSDETLEFARAYGEKLGKKVVVAQDRAGFIVNMLLAPFLNSAVKMYAEGFATKEDIDTAIKLGLGHPMGPLELLDFIGIDTMCAVSEVLFEEFRDPDYAPPPLARRMMQAGYHGRKTGKGFYEYGDR